jgi:hypothetical protein
LFVTRIYNEEYLAQETIKDEERMKKQWRKEVGIGEDHQRKPHSSRDIKESLKR